MYLAILMQVEKSFIFLFDKATYLAIVVKQVIWMTFILMELPVLVGFTLLPSICISLMSECKAFRWTGMD